MKKNIIYLYNDLGVSIESIKHTMYTLKQIVLSNYKIHFISASEIIENKWSNQAALLIIPGGRDIYYAKQLNGKGNKAIKDYVEIGGNYLGICAGAYYGSGFVEFDKDGSLEILGERELAFFPNKTIGPVLAKYNYENNSGVRAALIKLAIDDNSLSKKIMIYYNGGPYFVDTQLYKNINTLAYYQFLDQSVLPAVLKIKYNKGNVILSAVHFEYSSKLLNMNDKFHAQIVSELEQSEFDKIKFAGVIFKYLGLSTRHKVHL
ncbi:BPL-N domain-containing protein [Candidatus Tisiphia endosymbiont of Dascillus cervinus]